MVVADYTRKKQYHWITTRIMARRKVGYSMKKKGDGSQIIVSFFELLVGKLREDRASVGT